MKIPLWIRTCEDKLIQAAIDLAMFTQHGIHARDIVDLALITEELQKSAIVNTKPDEFRKKQKKLKKGIEKICQTGRKMWKDKPEKYQNYIWST